MAAARLPMASRIALRAPENLATLVFDGSVSRVISPSRASVMSDAISLIQEGWYEKVTDAVKLHPWLIHAEDTNGHTLLYHALFNFKTNIPRATELAKWLMRMNADVHHVSHRGMTIAGELAEAGKETELVVILDPEFEVNGNWGRQHCRKADPRYGNIQQKRCSRIAGENGHHTLAVRLAIWEDVNDKMDDRALATSLADSERSWQASEAKFKGHQAEPPPWLQAKRG